MRWSAWKGAGLGLSGTSLALAVGCAAPAPVDELRPMSDTTLSVASDAVTEAEADRERSEREARRRVDEDIRYASSQSDAWFLRPVGEPDTSGTQNVVVQPEQARPIANVSPEPVRPIARPRPRNNSWNIRAACGRG